MYHQLTEAERYTLSVLKRGGLSCRSIARILDRDPSTISREIKRNATTAPHLERPFYAPSKAQEHANGRRRRSRRVKHHGPEVFATLADRANCIRGDRSRCAQVIHQPHVQALTDVLDRFHGSLLIMLGAITAGGAVRTIPIAAGTG